MSSANPKSQEPTMEEILASIRRIIADDQAQSNEPEDEAEEDDLPAAVAAPAPVEDDEAEDEKNSQSAVDDMFDSLGDDFEEEEEAEPEPEPEDDGVLDLGAVAEPVAKAPARAVAAGPRSRGHRFPRRLLRARSRAGARVRAGRAGRGAGRRSPWRRRKRSPSRPRYVPPPMPEPPPAAASFRRRAPGLRGDRRGRRRLLQHVGPCRARQPGPHPRRSRQGDAAPDAEGLARRQPAHHSSSVSSAPRSSALSRRPFEPRARAPHPSRLSTR